MRSMRMYSVLMFATVCVLCRVAAQHRALSFDDDMAASLQREMQVHDMLEQKLPEEMGQDDQMRSSADERGDVSDVDKFIWQPVDSAQHVPLPPQLLPNAEEHATHSMFQHLFKGTPSDHGPLHFAQIGTSAQASTNEEGGGLIRRRLQQLGASPTITPQPSPVVEPPPPPPGPPETDAPPSPSVPPVPSSPSPSKPPVPSIPFDNVSQLSNKVKTFLDRINGGVFNELRASAYAPGERFVANAIKDLEEMWSAANGNIAKQIMVGEVANQYILPAVAGIWPALLYYNLEHIAVKEIAPSWWPTDPFPNVPGSKRLPDSDSRRGITGANRVTNLQLGLSGGNVGHHCTFNELLECID